MVCWCGASPSSRTASQPSKPCKASPARVGSRTSNAPSATRRRRAHTPPAATAKELPAARKYAVIGAGALGGFYGAMLQQAGHDVHFLVRSGYDDVSIRGFRVKSIHGDFHLPQVHAYRAPGDLPPCDVVLLATKTTSNHLLPGLLPVMKAGGVVLVMQNGLGVEPKVAALVGDDAVMGAGCFLCCNRLAPGVVQHVDYGDIVLGEYRANYAPGGVTPRMRQVGADFEAAGIRVGLEEDLFIARWKKLIWNIPYNGTCALLSATTDRLMANPHTAAMVHDLIQETVEAAEATARHLTPDLPPRRIPDGFGAYIMKMTAAMRPYKPSMLLDLAAGRPMEVEALYGAPLRMATQAACRVPGITMLHRQLLFLASQREATTGALLDLAAGTQAESL